MGELNIELQGVFGAHEIAGSKLPEFHFTSARKTVCYLEYFLLWKDRLTELEALPKLDRIFRSWRTSNANISTTYYAETDTSALLKLNFRMARAQNPNKSVIDLPTHPDATPSPALPVPPTERQVIANAIAINKQNISGIKKPKRIHWPHCYQRLEHWWMREARGRRSSETNGGV
ncbi:hypothetical protein CBL_05977 [Carabus blaptoides fortunei]